MISKATFAKATFATARRRLGFVAGSLFLAWHALAIVVGPAPASHAAGAAYPAFAPYLRVLDLDHGWSFFAPNPGRGRLLRYAVIDGAGARHDRRLTEALTPLDPAYLRWTTLYAYLDVDLPHHLRAAADHLCRRHRDLDPRAIVFVHRDQLTLTPESYRAGHRPLDEDYVTTTELAPLECAR